MHIYSLEKLQKLQNRASRVITGKSYDVRSKDILEELSWQPLMKRWGNNKAIFMHKVTNGEYLENISRQVSYNVLILSASTATKVHRNFKVKWALCHCIYICIYVQYRK